jgi:integrase
MAVTVTTRPSTMARVTVSITHIAWRNGRPRFVPGPVLRAMGYRGADLRNPVTGQWMDLMEAKAWSDTLCADIAARRQSEAALEGGRARASTPPVAAELKTLGEAAEEWLTVRTRAKEGEARRKRRRLSPASTRLYRSMLNHLERDFPATWATPVGAIRPAHMEQLYDLLDERKSMSVAAAIMQTLNSVFSWSVTRGLIAYNPVSEIELSRPSPNLRVGTIGEMQHLIATADAMGWPEIGDSIMLGLMTGQRLQDRLDLTEAGRSNGRIFLKQHKTGALVDIPEIGFLTTRLEAASARRKGMRINWPGIIINERDCRPFLYENYRRLFVSIVEQAATTMPELADFRDKHLRKTCVTWLSNAGCTPQQIAEITGHTLKSVHTILRHYNARDPERADTAILRMDEWLKAKGARL